MGKNPSQELSGIKAKVNMSFLKRMLVEAGRSHNVNPTVVMHKLRSTISGELPPKKSKQCFGHNTTALTQGGHGSGGRADDSSSSSLKFDWVVSWLNSSYSHFEDREITASPVLWMFNGKREGRNEVHDKKSEAEEWTRSLRSPLFLRSPRGQQR